jgi:hypothetical protein
VHKPGLMACLICDAQLFRVELALFLQRLHQCFWCGVFGLSEGLQSHCCVSTQWQSQSRCSRFGGNVRVPLLCLNTVAFSSFFGSVQPPACCPILWRGAGFATFISPRVGMAVSQHSGLHPPFLRGQFRPFSWHTQAWSRSCVIIGVLRS